MTDEEARGLVNGLYCIGWADGGYSVASVGRDRNGQPWFAPTNWINGVPSADWGRVDSVVLITTQAEEWRKVEVASAPFQDGNAALAKINGVWAVVDVVRVYRHHGQLRARVRRRGRTNAGAVYPLQLRPLDDLRRPLDAVPANVYADYLDEHDEPRAARKLREAFPLVEREAGS